MLQPGPRAQTTRARMERGVLIIVTVTDVSVKKDILECTAKSVRDKMSTVNLRYLHGCTDLDH